MPSTVEMEGRTSPRLAGRKVPWKAVSYDPHKLGTWSAFLMLKGTVFYDAGIWYNMLRLGMVAVVSGGALLLMVPDPEKLDVKKFHEAVNFIKVFIAFMLGLYLNSCLTRWWSIVSAMTDLFLSIKKVVWTLNSCGVGVDVRDRVRKFMVLSCYLLEYEIATVWSEATDDAQVQKWATTCETCLAKGVLTETQQRVLETRVHWRNRASAVWSWVAVSLQDIKSVSPPMMTRIMHECNESIEQLKKIKTYTTLQLPFAYAHMLAVLVQMNNILLAIACGLTCAVSLGEAYHQSRAILKGEGAATEHYAALYTAVQVLMVHLLSLIVEPILYQAFLVIAATLSDPFSSDSYGLPMLSYIEEMDDSLDEMNKFALYKVQLAPPGSESRILEGWAKEPKGEGAYTDRV